MSEGDVNNRSGGLEGGPLLSSLLIASTGWFHRVIHPLGPTDFVSSD